MSDFSSGLAVIGCGRWGQNHARTAARLWGKNLIYLCDSNPQTLKSIATVAPWAATTDSFDQVLADPKVKAVLLATPAETHFALALRALEAGKDVFVEKPLALQSVQAEHLNRFAHEKSRILMVGHILLYHPAVEQIKRLLTEGALGRLQYIYSNRLNLGAVRKEENILWSFAPHDISLLVHLIGESPVEVKATGGIFLRPGIHDVTLTSLKFAQNIHAHVHVSWLHPFKEHRLVLIGDRSMLVFEDSRSEKKLLLYPKGIDWVNGEPVKRDGEYQEIAFEKQEPLERELRHFGECLDSRKSPLTNASSAVTVLRILEEAQRGLELQNMEQVAQVSQPKRGEPNHQGTKSFFAHETAVIDEGCLIGAGTKIWHFSHIQPGARIGERCTLGQNVNVANNVVIGSGVKIQNNVSVYEGVELEDFVFCGPSMVFTNVLKPRCEFPQRGSEHYLRTLVRYGTSIGANATIVCGVTIGRFAFVGAGAVVTNDVPDYGLVVGNPAHLIGWICRCGERLETSNSSITCSKCSRDYKLINGRIQAYSDDITSTESTARPRGEVVHVRSSK